MSLVKIFIILVTLSACSLGLRKPAAGEVEFFTARNSILEVKGKAHALGGNWGKIKEAQLEFLAQIIEMYPQHEVYFLARDAEFLYDLLALMLKDDPEKIKHFHFINVSRLNVKSTRIKAYLEQEGMSEEFLQKGKALLVDTGFKGSISNAIEKLYSSESAKNIKTHLLCSETALYPSSRTFLWHLNPQSVSAPPGQMHGTIRSYEYLPRGFNRSYEYREVEGRLHPISEVVSAYDNRDGVVSFEENLLYREDLVAYSRENKTKESFLLSRERWRKIHGLTLSRDWQGLQDFLTEEGVTKQYSEAVLRDLVEMVQAKHTQLDASSVTLESFKLQSIGKERLSVFKIAMLDVNLKNHFTSLENGVDYLFNKKDFSKIGELLDLSHDRAFMGVIAKRVTRDFNDFDYRVLSLLIDTAIIMKDKDFLADLSHIVFASPKASAWKKLVDKIIEQALVLKNWEIVGDFSEHVMSQSFTDGWSDTAFKMILIASEIKDEDAISDLDEFMLQKNRSVKKVEWEKLAELTKISGHARRIQELKKVEQMFLEIDQEQAVKLNPTIKNQLQQISSELSEGDNISSDSGKYIVIKKVETGKRGVVFQVKSVETNELFALKIARDNSPETLNSFAQESIKEKTYKKYQVKHAKIIEAHPTYIIKKWIEGVRADAWLAKWTSSGHNQNAAELIELKKIITDLSQKGVYIGDLNAKNLIYANGSWVVVDSGSVLEGLSVNDAFEQFVQKVGRRWGKATNCIDTLTRLLR